MRSSPEVVRTCTQGARAAAPTALAFGVRARRHLNSRSNVSSRRALFARPLLFANDVLGVFVGPQAEIDRLAQLALAGPLREFHFRDQRRTHPGRNPLILHLAREGRLGCLEPHELAVKLFENLVAEAGADVADVPPCTVVAYRQHEGAEEGPGSPRRREAGDHYLLPVRGLHLQPIGGPASGRVRAVGALGHYTFEMSQLSFCEELCAATFAVVAECDQLVARQDGLEPLLALEERQRTEVLAVCEHEVKCAVQKLGLAAQGVLKQLEWDTPSFPI